GIIKKRSGDDGKTISKATITKCALTMNPVNTDTYADLVKSLSAGEVEFEGDLLNDSILPEKGIEKLDEKILSKGPLFTAEQVIELLQKALSVGAEYATTPPAQLSGGAALAQEDLDAKKRKQCKDCDHHESACKCLKEIKKGDSEFYKSI